MKYKIACLLDFLSNEYQENIFAAAHNAAMKQNMIVTGIPVGNIQKVDEDNTLYIKNFINLIKHCYDALLIIGAEGVFFDSRVSSVHPELYMLYKSMPVLSVSTRIDDIDYVTIDNAQGITLTFNHLFQEHNCRSFYYIGGPDEKYDAQQRLEGFKKAVSANSIPTKQVKTFSTDFYPSEVSDVLSTEDIRKKNLPDAIICANDQMAVNAKKYLAENGIKVPEDVLLTGFDNTSMARELGIASVQYPFTEVGTESIKFLKELLETGKTHTIAQIPVALQTDSSCGCSHKAVPQKNTEDTQLVRHLHRLSQSFNHLGSLETLKAQLNKVLSYLAIDNTLIFLNSLTCSKLHIFAATGLFSGLRNLEYMDHCELCNKALNILPLSAELIILPILTDNQHCGYFFSSNPRKSIMILENLNINLGNAIRSYFHLRNIKQSVEEKEVLLKELHHRVKNNLQVVLSLIRMKKRSVNPRNLSEVLDDIQTKIHSIAVAHDIVYQSSVSGYIELKEYVQSLLSVIQELYNNGAKIKFNLQGEDYRVPLQSSIYLGLVFNEIILNCTKHAFCDASTEGDNVVSIKMQKKADLLYISISDNGRGFRIDDFGTRNSGIKLIRLLIEQQLGGAHILESSPGSGTSHMISFHVPEQ